MWNPATDELTVRVRDRQCGAYFELHAQPDSALEVYHHPYSYAAFTGVRDGDDALAA